MQTSLSPRNPRSSARAAATAPPINFPHQATVMARGGSQVRYDKAVRCSWAAQASLPTHHRWQPGHVPSTRRMAAGEFTCKKDINTINNFSPVGGKW